MFVPKDPLLTGMNSGKIRQLLLLFAVGLALLFYYEGAQAKADHLDPKAVAVWHKYERDFEKGVNGDQGNNEFDKACLFFEQTTGLTMHVNDSTIGTLPTPESRQDLVRIRAWYKNNKARLYWDESTRTVKVRPEAAKP
jgi:hypothetical protein